MAKRVQVSSDSGTTWKTLPGSTADYKEEMSTVTDTVFGQDFESTDVSLGSWMVTCNGFFKNVPGYAASIQKGGSPTTMTGEAVTSLGSNVFQITNTSKRVIDYFTTLTVLDGVTDISATQVEKIDYLSGTVTLKSGYSVVGTITLTGKYIPMATLAKGRGFTLNMTAQEIDTTVYETARANGGWKTFKQGLKTASIDMSGLYDIANGVSAALLAKSPLIIECRPNNDAHTIFRGFFKLVNHGQQGNVGALEEETQTFNMWVPDGTLVATPFSWYFTSSSTMNSGSKDVLNQWLTGAPIDIKYQDDPNASGAGHTGSAIITQCSMTNAIDGLNEFKYSFRGNGTPSAV